MSQANIILTGFMGTGKTTLGRLLAERIGYEFIDTDALIEEQIGQTITELFQTQGEAAFRKLESELVEQLAQKEGLVIATGGGLVLNPKNVAVLSKTGQIICLTARPEEILARVSKQQDVRPLLQEKDPQAKIIELLEQRDSVYQQFPQLSTSEHSQEELIKQLVKLTQTE
ncbi:MAG: shikimate kinase [Thermodesulfobacteriota bacterium]|nr:shikimate kinase [Thermodesulfobacteriota bacterium]